MNLRLAWWPGLHNEILSQKINKKKKEEEELLSSYELLSIMPGTY
jgi:hypothetical protein